MEYLDKKIKDHKHLNGIFDFKHQKLEYLKNAQELGIAVPEWIVSADINTIRDFLQQKEKVITKALNMPYLKIPLGDDEYEMSYNTNLVGMEDLEFFAGNKNYRLLPSFFQEYIEKKFEIRSFFLDDKFYSMAIFSQQSEKTKVDYRNYDRERPNRAVPFQLPKELESKLSKLIAMSGLNSCSVDFIYATNGLFYFLEINPIGQFKWVSQNCNYYIEKEIADYYL
jgi:glutathione synthase/RimK-type ligase-like ATP-grasp enzyme